MRLTSALAVGLAVTSSLACGGVGASQPTGVGGAGAPDARPDVSLTPAAGTPGVWEDVTSPEMPASLFTGASGFGVGNIVVDPSRPSDLYVGGYGSIWKSTDYGKTWSMLDSAPNPAYLPLGHVLAVAGTTPATLWMANAAGDQKVFKSTDGGATFKLTGTLTEKVDASFYSIVVDPNDGTHLITGFHETDKVAESTDGGETWKLASGAGWPTGGISWFPFFVDTGVAATTRKTWFAIAQDGASAVRTSDGGATWSKPKGIEGLQHPHGCSQLYQTGRTLFIGGGQTAAGNGVFRSADLGATWSLVTEGNVAVVWGTAKNVYGMWGWACASCGLKEGGPQFQTASQPGDTWSKGPTLPDGLVWGPNSVAVTSDGVHSIFVGSMWATGLWRYVEP
jgi:BNR/Asp-box repeat